MQYVAFDDDDDDSWDSEVSDASATALGAHAAQQFVPTQETKRTPNSVRIRHAPKRVEKTRKPRAAPGSTALLPRERSGDCADAVITRSTVTVSLS